ncbi:hypothetical protein VTK26DRAFT_7340 [Humicola hyalothermophila]
MESEQCQVRYLLPSLSTHSGNEATDTQQEQGILRTVGKSANRERLLSDHSLFSYGGFQLVGCPSAAAFRQLRLRAAIATPGSRDGCTAARNHGNIPYHDKLPSCCGGPPVERFLRILYNLNGAESQLRICASSQPLPWRGNKATGFSFRSRQIKFPVLGKGRSPIWPVDTCRHFIESELARDGNSSLTLHL